MMEGDIIPIETSKIVRLPTSVEDIVEQNKQFHRLKAQLLDPKTDICTIKGTAFIKRTGRCKLQLAFNISDEIISEEKEVDEKGAITWWIKARAIAPNGRTSIGIGACSSKERDFAHLDHDVYAIAHTRAKNRAVFDLLGSGEVSAEEMQTTYTAPNQAVSEQQDPYIVDQQTVLNLLEDKGLDTTNLNIYFYARKLRIEPHNPLGESWQAYNTALAPLKPKWIKLGDRGRWEVSPP